MRQDRRETDKTGRDGMRKRDGDKKRKCEASGTHEVVGQEMRKGEKWAEEKRR